MPDDPFTPAELETATAALLTAARSPRYRPTLADLPEQERAHFDRYAAAVLAAVAPLIAARVRAEEREGIAGELRDLAGREPSGSVDQVVMLHASEVARAHRTTPGDDDA